MVQIPGAGLSNTYQFRIARVSRCLGLNLRSSGWLGTAREGAFEQGAPAEAS